jgi:hypothetical protein
MPNGIQNVTHAYMLKGQKNSMKSALTLFFNFMVITHIQVKILGKIVDLA